MSFMVGVSPVAELDAWWNRSRYYDDAMKAVADMYGIPSHLLPPQKENKMNYKLASELYKALDDGKVIQWWSFSENKFKDFNPGPNNYPPDIWNVDRWRIKPEPREFFMRVHETKGSHGPFDKWMPDCEGWRSIKVREVLED